jgi:hypothetical protein
MNIVFVVRTSRSSSCWDVLYMVAVAVIIGLDISTAA